MSLKGRICQLAEEVILKLSSDQNETKEKADCGFWSFCELTSLHTFSAMRLT